VGDPYEYDVIVSDVDGDAMTLTAVSKPAWATLISQGNGKAKLIGTPTAGSTGFTVLLRAKDAGTPVDQQYILVINTRPALTAFNLTTSEDISINFQGQSFTNAFSDADGDNISNIKITVLPKHGSLGLSGNAVHANDQIPFASITQLVYTPNANYSGQDTLSWNASDKYLAYSKTDAYISFVIAPVNDAPDISIEADTLKYEIGKGWIGMTTAFDVIDVDDDSLTLGEIGFRKPTFSSTYDELSFVNTTNITGTYDAQQGVLTFSGKAPLAEYINFVKLIQYRYTNTSKPKLDTKSVYITLSDGKSLSNTKDRFIELIYTFQDLSIVNGFTPNGDGVNDVWEVIKPERKEDLKQSKITIYDLSGRLIYETVGFDESNLWDGSYKGKMVPQGGYFYTIEVVDSKLASLKKVYKGIVNVIY
jgi:gliding motility-associated-like protein